MSDFKVLLSNLLKARFPYIYIPTWEERRVLLKINDIASDENLIRTKRKVFTWRVTTGLMELKNSSIKENTQAPLKASRIYRTI